MCLCSASTLECSTPGKQSISYTNTVEYDQSATVARIRLRRTVLADAPRRQRRGSGNGGA